MMRARAFLAVCVLAAMPVAAGDMPVAAGDVPAPARAAAEAFAAALEQDDLGAFDFAPGLDRNEIGSVQELVEAYTCPEVHGHAVRVAPDGVIEVTVRGTALTAGEPRRIVPIPPVWRLRLDGGGRIVEAETALNAFVRELVDAPDGAARARLLAGRDDLEAIALALNARFRLRHGFAGATQALLERSRAAGDLAAEAECLRNQAVIMRSKDPALAEQLVERSLAIARDLGSVDAEARALFTYGVIFWVNERAAESLLWMERSAALAEWCDDPRTSIKASHMSGVIAGRSGDHGKGLAISYRTFALARRYGWREGESAALLSAQAAHTQLRQHDIAARIGRQAYEVALAAGVPGHVAMAAANVAENEAELGNYEAASSFIAAAERLQPGSLVHFGIESTRAKILAETGRLDAAEATLRCLVASPFGDRRVHADMLARLAVVVLRRGDAAQAMEIAAEADALLTAAGETGTGFSRFAPWTPKTVRGRALMVLGHPDEAAAELQAAIDLIERRRASAAMDELARTAYLEDKTDPYRALVRLHFEEGRTGEALRVADRMKGRTLADVADRGHLDLSAWMTGDEKARQRQLEEKLAAANRAALAASRETVRETAEAVSAARLELRRFHTELYALHPQLRARAGAGEDAILEVPRALGDVAIVQYVVTETDVLAFVIARGAPIRAVEIPIAEEELRARVDSALRKIQTRDIRYAAEGRELHRLLLGSLPADVMRREAICIIPDGALWQLPFQALVAADGRYVVERTAVFYAPSMAVLHRMTAAAPREGALQLLAFANPLHGPGAASEVRALYGADLGPLPETESEVETLRRLYGRARSRVYVGEHARESVVKTGTARASVLHVATHAFADPRAPLFSALLLAPDPDGDDGLLEAREIAELDLDVRIAVLSACDTARGGIAAGEGVVGLSWAFFAAGVPTTVVSQWKAASRPTERLMVEFHRHLLAGRAPAAALRHAQRALMRDARYRAPFYWAPFTVVGAGTGR